MILHQVAQHADDLERATAFYTRLIGEPPIATFDPPGLVFFKLGEISIKYEGILSSCCPNWHTSSNRVGIFKFKCTSKI